MPIIDLKELKARIPPKKRLLGLDQGTKTIGLAVSDGNWMLAAPLQTITRGKFSKDVIELAKVIKEYEIGGLIIGLPRNMDGSEGPRCQSVRHFAENLVNKADQIGFDPLICFQDERLSTSAVERFMIDELDLSRKRRAEVVDKMAAAHILQGALDQLRYLPDELPD
ncbi:MAG: Holliday junction resolvase RuvX [Pseudomonadota bacterium]